MFPAGIQQQAKKTAFDLSRCTGRNKDQPVCPFERCGCSRRAILAISLSTKLRVQQEADVVNRVHQTRTTYSSCLERVRLDNVAVPGAADERRARPVSKSEWPREAVSNETVL
jgi:hypothetical protein